MSCKDCAQLREDLITVLGEVRTSDFFNHPHSLEEVLGDIAMLLKRAVTDRETGQRDGGPFLCGYGRCVAMRMSFDRRDDLRDHMALNHPEKL